MGVMQSLDLNGVGKCLPVESRVLGRHSLVTHIQRETRKLRERGKDWGKTRRASKCQTFQGPKGHAKV